MTNRFVELIRSGRIRDEAALKTAYRSIVKLTHPDSVGSEKMVRAFVALRIEYEDALRFLRETDSPGTAPVGTAAAGRPPASSADGVPVGSRGTGAGAAAEMPPDDPATRRAGGAHAGQPAGEVPVAVPVRFLQDRASFYIAFEEILARGFPLKPRTRSAADRYDRTRTAILGAVPALAGLDLRLFGRFEAEMIRMREGPAIGTYDAVRKAVYAAFDYHDFGLDYLKPVAAASLGAARCLSLESGMAATADLLAILAGDLDRGPALA